jgi:hypothetical protein
MLIQSALRIAKDAPSRRGSKSQQERSGIVSSFRRTLQIIAQYDPENVYNMDKTRLFFRLLPKYSLLMPNEDISTTRGKKKTKD